jgi:uncharacterized membrane protein YeaQ/YmgE (transglycosylase-associated protein family)
MDSPTLQNAQQRAAAVPAVVWIMVLGAIGFLTGFFGPMIFSPESNQGPLVGIFFSGPAGAVLGLLLWGVCRVGNVQRQRTVLVWSGIAVFLLTLSLWLPQIRH